MQYADGEDKRTISEMIVQCVAGDKVTCRLGGVVP
jgi:hypothetical protein